MAGHDRPEIYGLVFAIMADNTTGGMVISVFIAYLLYPHQHGVHGYPICPVQLPDGAYRSICRWIHRIACGTCGRGQFFLITSGMGIPAIFLAIATDKNRHPDHTHRPGITD